MKTKRIARKIFNAIIQGAHTTDMIIRNQNLELEYTDVCKTLAKLEADGVIEYHNRNLAKEYGYFITEAGWMQV